MYYNDNGKVNQVHIDRLKISVPGLNTEKK